MSTSEELGVAAMLPWGGLRRWLGPLGRYRPSVFRKNMAAGFKCCDGFWWRWSWLPQWSSPEEHLLESLDLRGKVVYDVGAYTGSFSLFFSRQVGVDGTVVAFEPQPGAFSKLTRNLRLNQVVNVYAFALALGATAAERPIFVLPGMSTTASLAPESDTPIRRRAGEAHVAALDHVVAAMLLPAPDFIKVDVEGMELDMLRGAVKTLTRYRSQLLIEVHGSDRSQKTERVRALARLLDPLGYVLVHAESGRTLNPGSSSGNSSSIGRGSSDSTAIAAGHLYARPRPESGSSTLGLKGSGR